MKRHQHHDSVTGKKTNKKNEQQKPQHEDRVMRDDSMVSFVSFVTHSLRSGQALRAFVLK
jgi:hypothetical protein